jgi:hypothetical protein
MIKLTQDRVDSDPRAVEILRRPHGDSGAGPQRRSLRHGDGLVVGPDALPLPGCCPFGY